MSTSLVRMKFAAVAVKIETTPGGDAIGGTPANSDFIAADCEVDFDPQLIDNHFDRVIFPPVERQFIFERTDDAINPRFDEALARQFFQIFFELALAAPHNGSHDKNFCVRT